MAASLLALAKSIYYTRLTFKGNRKKFEISRVWVIGSSKQMARSKGKTSFYCALNILINN